MSKIVLNGLTTTGQRTLSVKIPYEHVIDRLRARVAMLNHNLNPNPDAEESLLVSWCDLQDVPLMKFSLTALAERIGRRLSAWDVKLTIEPEMITFVFENQICTSPFAETIAAYIEEILYHGAYADKLTLSVKSLEGILKELRQAARNRCEYVLCELVSAMAIIENE